MSNKIGRKRKVNRYLNAFEKTFEAKIARMGSNAPMTIKVDRMITRELEALDAPDSISNLKAKFGR